MIVWQMMLARSRWDSLAQWQPLHLMVSAGSVTIPKKHNSRYVTTNVHKPTLTTLIHCVEYSDTERAAAYSSKETAFALDTEWTCISQRRDPIPSLPLAGTSTLPVIATAGMIYGLFRLTQ